MSKAVLSSELSEGMSSSATSWITWWWESYSNMRKRITGCRYIVYIDNGSTISGVQDKGQCQEQVKSVSTWHYLLCPCLPSFGLLINPPVFVKTLLFWSLSFSLSPPQKAHALLLSIDSIANTVPPTHLHNVLASFLWRVSSPHS